VGHRGRGQMETRGGWGQDRALLPWSASIYLPHCSGLVTCPTDGGKEGASGTVVATPTSYIYIYSLRPR
jgi:hypothetical protein